MSVQPLPAAGSQAVRISECTLHGEPMPVGLAVLLKGWVACIIDHQCMGVSRLYALIRGNAGRENIANDLVGVPEWAGTHVGSVIPGKYFRYIAPKPDTNLRERTTRGASLLLEVISVAIIACMVRIRWPQARSGAGAEPGLGELALDGHAPVTLDSEINRGGSRFAKVIDSILKLQSGLANAIEKCRQAFIGFQSLKQGRLARGDQVAKHALRQGLGTAQAAKVPMAFLPGQGGLNGRHNC
jgi:hypothetical protein